VDVLVGDPGNDIRPDDLRNQYSVRFGLEADTDAGQSTLLLE
jgi:hypothetical protein